MRGKKVHKNQMSLFDFYNYEETFNTYLNESNSQKFEDFHKIIGQGYTTKTIKSGEQFEVEIYPHFKKPLENYLAKTIITKQPSSKEQKNLNNKNSRKKLERLIHCNFGVDDYWCTYTFNDDNNPENLQKARQLFKNAIKCINRKRKKLNFDNAKYIYVIEKGKKGRYHIHFVIDNALPASELAKFWKHGYNDVKKINYRGDDDLIAIAKYMHKDPQVYPDFNDGENENVRRWDSSKGNLKQPIERKNRSVFSKKKVIQMSLNQNNIQAELEKQYQRYDFKEAQVRFNEFNGLFYIHARMQTKKNQRIRI